MLCSNRRFLALLLLALGSSAARATVADSSAADFHVQFETVVDSPPNRVWQALTAEIGAWWHPGHTFSGDAARLTLDARPGGQLLERLPQGGGVEHLRVVHADPGRLLRLEGALGPLQGFALTGRMDWTLAPAPGESTRLQLHYRVAGAFPGGCAAVAPAVDGVLGQQFERLATFAETGSPKAEEGGR